MIFDMDETLIHKVDSSDKCVEPDMWLDIKAEDNLNTHKVSYQVTFTVIDS